MFPWTTISYGLFGKQEFQTSGTKEDMKGEDILFPSKLEQESHIWNGFSS